MQQKFEMFTNRLKKVFLHLSKQAKKRGVSCFRIYNYDLPEFPLLIEKYEQVIYIAEYENKYLLNDEQYTFWLNKVLEIIEKIIGISKENIIIRNRKKIIDRTQQYQKIISEKNEIIVQENSLKFIINLSNYLDTGLFLDNREVRKFIGEKCYNKKVLNLFAYTGSFSVYAAANKALEITTVDLSNTYLKWAEKNFEINQLSQNEKYKFIQENVLEYIVNIPKNYYDIIIVDPPSFSNSKRMKTDFSIQLHHPQLINLCLQGLVPNGELFFCTNLRKFQIQTNLIHTNNILDITKATTPFDFAGKINHTCFIIKK